jgi:hypothetical protein
MSTRTSKRKLERLKKVITEYVEKHMLPLEAKFLEEINTNQQTDYKTLLSSYHRTWKNHADFLNKRYGVWFNDKEVVDGYYLWNKYKPVETPGKVPEPVTKITEHLRKTITPD